MGSKRCCSFAEEASLLFAVVKSGEAKAALSGTFFKVVVLKKGNKQSKETSPATACPPAKALFGQG